MDRRPFLLCTFANDLWSSSPSEQRGEEPVNSLLQADDGRHGVAVGLGDLLAVPLGVQEVVPHRDHRRVPAQPHPVFKLEIKAPVIQVAAAHAGIEVIRHHRLAVEKARGELDRKSVG